MEFERERLFEEVWSMPMTTLAKKYGISDNGLRKICIALAIPLPQRGHWARVAAGKSVPSPQLKPHTGANQYTFYRAESAPVKSPNDDHWLAERLAFEEDPANKIVVADELLNPDKIVVGASKVLRELLALIGRSKKYEDARFEREKLPWTGVHHEYFGDNSWSNYLSRGGIIELPHDALPTRVSIESVDRALRLWDAIIKAAKNRGIKVNLVERRLRLTIREESVDLRMSEQVKPVVGKGALFPDCAFPPEDHKKKLATGALRIFICHMGEQKFEDKEGVVLEDQINILFRAIYKSIWSGRLRTLARIEDQRVKQLEDEAANQRKLEAAAREAVIADNKRRIDDLIVEADNWHRANRVRAYVSYLKDESSKIDISQDMQRWLQWAEEVVEILDPSRSRLK
ncbi:hypothetical protein GTP23_12835 [Pseudoduganella sp. FT93W]|uniref:Uncharacterized protein n=1 Tax=Duganella fentianensis TaxID=2692177 RepID=A0A845HX13_9BURK|nr:hypothetical protein [Duganella fentianensis]MYN45934.1 hypothetical protein [Duganella fentianensis]